MDKEIKLEVGNLICCNNIYGYQNYAPFEGEYPQWAKDALNKLEY